MEHLPLFGILLLFMVQAIVAELPEYQGCGATIRGIPEGTINYPNNLGDSYPHKQDCKWTIIVGEGERMILSFERFHIAKTKDSLVIKNGEKGTSIGAFGWKGPKIPPIIESEANEIFLHFTSDKKKNDKGFKMTWKTMMNDVSESGNQCMANATANSVLWQQVISSEMAVKTTVKESNDNVIGAMTFEMEDLKLELQEMTNKLQEINNKQETTQSQLQKMTNRQDTSQKILQEMQTTQETTQIKLDLIIELLMGMGCWSVMSKVAHPQGFSETHDCIMYTCTNGKWLKDGPDPDCDNDNKGDGCSPMSPVGTISYYKCDQVECKSDKTWQPTGERLTNCSIGSVACWDWITHETVSIMSTMYFECNQYLCTEEYDWQPNGERDPECETNGCFSPITQSVEPFGTKGYYKCEEIECTANKKWEMTGKRLPGCPEGSMFCLDWMQGSAVPIGSSMNYNGHTYICTDNDWEIKGTNNANTESPIPTDGDSMVSAEPPVIPTEVHVIPTEAPYITTESPIPTDGDIMVSAEPPVIPTKVHVIPTEAPYITTESPTNDDSDSGSDCDYSTTFSTSHSKNLSPKAECGAFHKTGASVDEITAILQIHNELREYVAKGLETKGLETPQPGATNMLEMQWNIELAEVAQAWAEQCMTPDLGSHDQYDNRKICSRDYYVGQNIAFRWGGDAASAWNASIKAWYSEVKDMPLSQVQSYGSYTNAVIGHYTQVVWAATYEVGCGAIHYQDTWQGNTYPESKLYVCNYGPAGNFRNQPVYDIDDSGTAAATNCPNGPSSTYPGLCATPIPA